MASAGRHVSPVHPAAFDHAEIQAVTPKDDEEVRGAAIELLSRRTGETAPTISKTETVAGDAGVVETFNFHGHEVRIVKRDGEPWFVAVDVCAVLGLDNIPKAVSRLDDDERNTITIGKGNRGNPNKTVISESGLYSLVLRSNKPEAKTFKRWVTGDVLPCLGEINPAKQDYSFFH